MAETKDDYAFRAWMKKVNSAIQDKVGLSSEDLPDCCYRDWYEDDVSPKQAANKAIRNA